MKNVHFCVEGFFLRFLFSVLPKQNLLKIKIYTTRSVGTIFVHKLLFLDESAIKNSMLNFIFTIIFSLKE